MGTLAHLNKERVWITGYGGLMWWTPNAMSYEGLSWVLRGMG